MNADEAKNPTTKLLMATSFQLVKLMWVISKQMITNDKTELYWVEQNSHSSFFVASYGLVAQMVKNVLAMRETWI